MRTRIRIAGGLCLVVATMGASYSLAALGELSYGDEASSRLAMLGGRGYVFLQLVANTLGVIASVALALLGLGLLGLRPWVRAPAIALGLFWVLSALFQLVAQLVWLLPRTVARTIDEAAWVGASPTITLALGGPLLMLLFLLFGVGLLVLALWPGFAQALGAAGRAGRALPILALAASVPLTEGCTRSSDDRAPADQALATAAQGPDNRREAGETGPAVAPSASEIYRTFAWDVTAKRETWTRFGIECLQFSASTSRLLCVRGIETLLLDAATGEELATLPVHGLVAKQGGAFSPRGSYIITRSNLSEYAVREGLSGKLINTIVSPGTPRSMAVSPDESMIAIAGLGGPVRGNLSDPRVRAAVRRPVLLFALPSGERLAELQVPTSSQVDTLQFVGNWMLAAGTYDDLTMFELRERTIARQRAAPSQMSFGSMTISPDGTTMVVTRLLSTGGTDLWDIESNSPIKALVPGKGRLHVRFADGKTLVSWGQDSTISFLDSRTGAADRELSLPIASSARDVTWSSDLGVVAAIADGTAWVWDHDGGPLSLQDGSRRMRHAMVTGDGSSVIVTAVDEREELAELARELRKAAEKLGSGR